MIERKYDHNPNMVGLVFRMIAPNGPMPFMKQWADLLKAWLWSADVFCADLEVEYNDFYHFYKVQIFAHMENTHCNVDGKDMRVEHFEEAIEALRAHGHVVEAVAPTWRWRQPESSWRIDKKDLVNGNAYVPGIEFWIYPEGSKGWLKAKANDPVFRDEVRLSNRIIDEVIREEKAKKRRRCCTLAGGS